MDALVKSALEKVQETVHKIPWDALEPNKGKQFNVTQSENIKNSIDKAVHAVDALRSALKTIW
jgi:hypothetical protein